MRTPLILILLIVAVYGAFVARAGVVYEDTNGGDAAIVAPWPDGPPTGRLWRPRMLTNLTYRLNAWLGGAPAVFHGTNVALHAAVSVGLFALTGSALAGGVLAVHPLASEAVAYIAARTEIVAALGLLVVLAGLSRRQWMLWLVAGVWLAWQGSALTAIGLLLAWPFAAPLAGWDARAARQTALGLGLVAAAAVWWMGPLASPAELTPIGGAWVFVGQQVAAAARLLAQLLVPIGQSIELPAASDGRVFASLLVLCTGTLVAWRFRDEAPRTAAAWLFLVSMLAPRVLLPRFEGLHERHLYAALAGALWCLAQKGSGCSSIRGRCTKPAV